MNLKNIQPYNLDWGNAIADGFNSTSNEIILIFNFKLQTTLNLQNVSQFVIGRVCWLLVNSPKETKISITFDIRGQDIIISKSTKIKNHMIDIINKVVPGNIIKIEFFR